jgi:hypothetical protein
MLGKLVRRMKKNQDDQDGSGRRRSKLLEEGGCR